MRHRKSFNHLGRKPAHRKAMLSNMAASLILNKRITTTTAKAKELRSFVEPLLTKAKDDTTHSRRVVFSYLQDKNAVSELFREISPKIAERPGGYTRILKIGNRLGDNADMAIIELVDYNENLLTQKSGKAAGKRKRRGSGSGAKKEAPVTQEVVKEAGPAVEDAEVVEETAEVVTETTEVKEEVQETPQAEEEQVEEVVEEKPADTPVEEVKAEEASEEETKTEISDQADTGEQKEDNSGEEEKEK